MEMLLDNAVHKINFPVPLLRKYVDDIILALPENKIAEVLGIFNSCNSNIQFTCEREKQQRIPFFDMVLVRRDDQTVRTEWYSKPMATGRFLDFLSTHPLHMKLNLVANFVKRVTTLSTNLTQEAIRDIIDKHLRINHYPVSLRHRITNRINQTRTTNTQLNLSETVYKPMLFVSQLTQHCKNAKK